MYDGARVGFLFVQKQGKQASRSMFALWHILASQWELVLIIGHVQPMELLVCVLHLHLSTAVQCFKGLATYICSQFGHDT